jgi:hypothetical protein
MRCVGEVRHIYKIVILKSEWKRPLGRPRRRWYENTWMSVEQMESESVDWVHLRIGILIYSCEYGNKVLSFIKVKFLS